VTVRIDRIVYNSRGMQAWVELHHKDSPVVDGKAPPVFGQWNLLAHTTVPGIAKRWDQAHGTTDEDRQGVLEPFINDAVHDVIEMFREGPDPIDLAAAPDTTGGWLLAPFVERRAHSRLIAAGGSGKSYLALAMGLTVATGARLFGRCPVDDPQVTGPVAYLDWESDATTHSQRMRQLLDGVGLPVDRLGLVNYFAMRGPLHRQTIGVQRRIEATGCVMAVVDSVMLARGSSGEGGAEDSTVRLFEALDELAVPCLLIDHKSKAQVKSRSGLGGYGSVVMTNSVRNEWDAFQVFHADSLIRIGMRHTKQNNTAARKDIALSLNFAGDRSVKIASHQSFTHDEEMPTVEQVALAITGNPMSVPDLAARLDKPANTIRVTLGRHASRFTELAGNPAKWCNTDEVDDYLPAPF
jgi:hypothetical protein